MAQAAIDKGVPEQLGLASQILPVRRTRVIGKKDMVRNDATPVIDVDPETQIVVSAGGVPTTKGARKVIIQLSNQATFVPRSSRLTLTLASSSTAQSTSNLLYLDLPMPPSARARVGTAVLTLPGLRSPVTK